MWSAMMDQPRRSGYDDHAQQSQAFTDRARALFWFVICKRKFSGFCDLSTRSTLLCLLYWPISEICIRRHEWEVVFVKLRTGSVWKEYSADAKMEWSRMKRYWNLKISWLLWYCWWLDKQIYICIILLLNNCCLNKSTPYESLEDVYKIKSWHVEEHKENSEAAVNYCDRAQLGRNEETRRRFEKGEELEEMGSVFVREAVGNCEGRLFPWRLLVSLFWSGLWPRENDRCCKPYV